MCCSTAARVILVLINIAIGLVGLAVVTLGALLKFASDKFIQIVLGASSFAVQSSDTSAFHIPTISQVSQLPFLEEAGYALMVFGAVLFFVAFTACCGACCQYNVLLYLFAVIMSLLIIAQAVVFGLLMTPDSVMNKSIKDTLGNKVKSDFHANGQDIFSFAINLLNYLLDCCGIRGQDDFTQPLPPTCCLKSIIDGNDSARKNACTSSTPAPSSDYNTGGCYDSLLKKITSNVVAASIIVGIILLLQTVEVFLAILIAKNNKISPL